MSGEIATFERVRDVVETMRKRGVSPTADRVIAMVGGGSKTTVLAHLKRLRDAQPETEAVPASVLDLARDALCDIYLAGRSAEASTVRAATERLSQVVSDQDAQIEELADQNTRLEWSKEQLVKQLHQALAERQEFLDRAERSEAEVTTLRGQLSEERGKVDADLRNTLAKMEHVLSKAQIAREAREIKRQTLGMPRPDRHKRGDARSSNGARS